MLITHARTGVLGTRLTRRRQKLSTPFDRCRLFFFYLLACTELEHFGAIRSLFSSSFFVRVASAVAPEPKSIFFLHVRRILDGPLFAFAKQTGFPVG